MSHRILRIQAQGRRVTSTVTQHEPEHDQDKHGSNKRAALRAAMSHLSAQQPNQPTVAAFATALAGHVSHISALLTTAVTRQVTAYTDPEAQPLISNAITGALKAFSESLLGPSITGPKLDEHFRNLGFNESLRDQELIDLNQAIHIGVHESWKELSDAALAFGLPAQGLAHLGDSIFLFADHLLRKVEEGRAAALKRTSSRKHKLLTAIREGTQPERLIRLAAEADWKIPNFAVAITLRQEDVPQPFPVPNGVLMNATGTQLLAPLALSEVAIAAASQVSPAGPISISWAVPLEHAGQALSWTERVLNLVDRQVIPPAPIIWCEDHRTEIWLHSEPAMRQRLCQDLLQPLLAETPNSREILSETLLTWLETRDSAPAIAAYLGVHPQTVRYRWKRINELFGDSLHDPGFIVQITMLLKASLPLWRAGDQSDFDRFFAEQEGTS